MSGRRKLNNDELRACSAFATALDRSEYTQESLGAAVGMTQGAVGQFSRGMVAIPANRAAHFGALLRVSPAEISVEYAEKIAPFITDSAASQSQRTVTAKMVASASQLAAEILEGFDPRNVDDSAFFANTINWMIQNGLNELGTADTVRLMREIAENVGTEGNGGVDRQAIQHLSGRKTTAKRGKAGDGKKGEAA